MEFVQNTLSWFSNYLFGEYSDESVVPYSYEGAAISNSYEKTVPFNMREEEVVSGIRDNTVQLDLNFPVEDSYGVQPDFRVPVEDLYGVQLDLNVHVEDLYTPQFENPYGQPNTATQDYTDQGHGDEQEDPLVDKDGCYPVIFSFDQTVRFSSRDELVDWVQNTEETNGYVIVIRRSNKRGSNFKVWFQCSLGGDYKSVATVRKTGSKKIRCPFEIIGFTEFKGSV